MSPVFKRIAIPLVLISLLAAMLFTSAMARGSGGRMQGDCPFSTMAVSCPQDALAAAVHHISAFVSFLNVPIVLFTIIFTAFIFSLPLLRRPLVIGYLYNPPRYSQNRKITRWLSLFENSPPLRYSCSRSLINLNYYERKNNLRPHTPWHYRVCRSH